MPYFLIGYETPHPSWMLVNKSDYNKLPSRYKYDLEKLSEAINAESAMDSALIASDIHPILEKQRKLFETFSKKYTMHIEILRKWKKLETNGIDLFDTFLLEERETFINIKASQHFYDESFLNFSFSDKNELPVLNK
uniref:Uncharacterized protein n=1 Tax=Panagrolaimus sp. PS1159 TaxID=55785 RepID=A0AC35GJS0_9BILA